MRITGKQQDMNRQQDLQFREQEQLVKEWLRMKGINHANLQSSDKKTLLAIKIAKGMLDNTKYPLTAQQAKQFQSFIIKANKGKNTGRETIDIFRQSKAIKRRRQAVL